MNTDLNCCHWFEYWTGTECLNYQPTTSKCLVYDFDANVCLECIDVYRGTQYYLNISYCCAFEYYYNNGACEAIAPLNAVSAGTCAKYESNLCIECLQGENLFDFSGGQACCPLSSTWFDWACIENERLYLNCVDFDVSTGKCSKCENNYYLLHFVCVPYRKYFLIPAIPNKSNSNLKNIKSIDSSFAFDNCLVVDENSVKSSKTCLLCASGYHLIGTKYCCASGSQWDSETTNACIPFKDQTSLCFAFNSSNQVCETLTEIQNQENYSIEKETGSKKVICSTGFSYNFEALACEAIALLNCAEAGLDGVCTKCSSPFILTDEACVDQVKCELSNGVDACVRC